MTPQQLKSSILHTAIQGKLVKQNESECPVDLRLLRKKTDEFEFKIPENWRIAHLETVSAVVPSKKYQILESEVLKRGRHPVISQSKLFSIGYSNDEKKTLSSQQFCYRFWRSYSRSKVCGF